MMKRNVVALALLATALFATSCGSTKKKKSDDDFYDFDKKETTQETTKKAKDRVYDASGDGTYTKPSESNVSKRFEEVEIVRGAVDYDAKYFIILGSFSVEENANKLVGTLAKQGFAPNILRSPSGMYRVSGYYFNDEQAARMEVDVIRKKHPEYNDLWLLIKK